MTEPTESQAGTLEVPEDAGKGPQGVVARWMAEWDLADKEEENWRKRAKDVNQRYRDEKSDASKGGTYSIESGRYSTGNRFNILYSNVQTIVPALYNQSPKPDVRRRYRDADPTGKTIAEVLERGLSYTMDEEDLDRFMRLAIKDQQLAGRGVTRVKYEPYFDDATDDDGEEYQEKKYEEVEWCHVNWADFRRGPARIWEECGWVGFKHLFTKDAGTKQFGEVFDDVLLDYSPVGMEDKEEDTVADTFKRAVVYEIWDKEAKEVIFIAPSLKERPLKTEDDPLGLAGFFPIPRPLYATENTDSLTPVEPFRFYQDQADELDEMTKRISGIIKACKVRGIYDTTINEMSSLMDAGENVLIPAGDVLPLMQAGGLDKAIWVWPIEKIAGVLVHLYTQREAIKTTIYEITGIADIMRGSSAAQETLGAQQLKAQFGTMRLDDMRREVQRYARDLIRMAGEIMSEKFSTDTLAIMTDMTLPTEEQKMQAQQMAAQMQQQGQEIPSKLQKVLDDPTWDEALQVLRDDKQRSYRIDIETDSTVAGDQAADQKAITELLTGISTFIQNAGPAVEAGYIPLEAAKSLIMTAVRRFKLGREVEDALDMIGEDEGEKQQQPDPQAAQMMEQFQQLQQEHQQMGQENQQLKAEKAAKDGELAIKDREVALKEFEVNNRQPEAVVDDVGLAFAENEKERDRQQFEERQNIIKAQVELAKAIISKSDNAESEVTADSAINDASAMMEHIVGALTAPRMVIRDEMTGEIIGSETVL